MNICTLLLGTNLGDRLANLKEATQLIRKHIGDVVDSSSIYQTASWGREELPFHYNQALIIHTILAPTDVLLAIHIIEHDMGRIRDIRWGERIIDIDIIFYNDEIISTDILEIPHPRLTERRFALIPITEIMPEYTHPATQHTMSALLEMCPDPLAVEQLSE